MSLKAVCFDMDGVTIDSEPLYAKAEIRLFREYGVEIPDEDWILFRGCNEKKFYELSMKRYSINEEKNLFIAKGRSYIKKEFTKNLKFMNGFINLHKNLIKHGISTALVTASPEKMFNFVNLKMKLTNKFDKVIFGEMTKYHKPNPEPYLLAMDQLDMKPKDTLIIEDSMYGLQAAKSSGAVVIGIRGSIPDIHLQIADFVISSLTDLNIMKLKKIHKTYNLKNK